jgi:hypothetical protein
MLRVSNSIDPLIEASVGESNNNEGNSHEQAESRQQEERKIGLGVHSVLVLTVLMGIGGGECSDES